jgi:serine protease Do
LLAALNQLRLLLTQRQKAFSNFEYFGTEPLDGGTQMVDVLVSNMGSVECHWYFSTANGALMGFDTWLLPDTDPCEVRFREIGSFDGLRFPAEIVVRHGDSEFATFRVQRIKDRK